MTCKIIGVLDNGIDGLTANTLSIIQSANLVIGAKRTLNLFSEQIEKAEKKDLTGHLKQVPSWITGALQAKQEVVVLATGDPLCHALPVICIKNYLPHNYKPYLIFLQSNWLLHK